MPKNLVIVESPAKAKTIGKYLGDDFQVEASYGHIRDLPKDDSAVVIDKKTFTPVYAVPADKAERVNALKKLAAKADVVWLATDEDREGEAISWHLCEVLGLNPKKTNRIVFHEITKTAIQQAIQNPRYIDQALVDAQQARRILDRLVGFELSPILWKKVKFGLSAGRVQSVAVRLIVEREREIAAFKSSNFFNVAAQFKNKTGKNFKATLSKKLANAQAAQQYLELSNGASFKVASIETKPGKRTPAAPFTTSTLQQEASRKLGYSVSQTMRLAQTLYEEGHITYMRTDSVNLSKEALAAAQGAITSEYGERYHKYRTYSTKTANAQEAHEAIRPTDFRARQVTESRSEQRLYELIWKRAVASQMADAQLEKTTVEIAVQPKRGSADSLTATGEVVIFDGFLKLYLEGKDEEENDENADNDLLPPLAVGDVLDLQWMTATERFTRAPARYNEAALVKALEELGIGRPSTYAPTISTVQKRNYVIKEDRQGTQRQFQVLRLQDGKLSAVTETENTGAERNKLFPTDLGTLVTDFLVAYFPDVIDYSFTARVEEEFDEIARGEMQWNKMLGEFYFPFKKKVTTTTDTAERVDGERILGKDPKTGKQVLARLGKYGPIVQLGTQDDEDKKFASLRTGMRLESVTLEDAIELFKLPRIVGKYENETVQANVGRFGPYVLHAKKFYSLPKEVDPLYIDLDKAIEIILAKRKAEAERVIKVFEGTTVQVLNGRWGPYVDMGERNLKIPKDVDPKSLTLQQIYEMAEQQPESKGRFGKKKATTAKPSASDATQKKTKAKPAAKPTPRKRAKTATAKKLTEAKKPAAKKPAAKKPVAKKATSKAAATQAKPTAKAVKKAAPKKTAAKKPTKKK